MKGKLMKKKTEGGEEAMRRKMKDRRYWCILLLFCGNVKDVVTMDIMDGHTDLKEDLNGLFMKKSKYEYGREMKVNDMDIWNMKIMSEMKILNIMNVNWIMSKKQ